ncbi:hypothetical protein J6590_072964 [Homalodisca vitripennis]|nr:hypothetical protein J6590_072964 [Homalodisca vitripennis]
MVNQHSLNIYYQNVRGMRTKTFEFYESILGEDFDLIALTETWLEPGISSSEIFDARYEVFRKDRDQMATGKGRGGGVLLAVHRRVSAVLMTHPLIADDLDLLLVRLTLPPPQGTVLVSLLYIPPGRSAHLYTNYYPQPE